jgi:hypothetical protein
MSSVTWPGNPGLVPLVLFEHPDILELRVARLKNAHLLNTAAMLIGLADAGVEPEGRQILKRVNEFRKSPNVASRQACQDEEGRIGVGRRSDDAQVLRGKT